ncbi:hypothetical protein EMCRGX_G000727 [Ephydatia muelleri]
MVVTYIGIIFFGDPEYFLTRNTTSIKAGLALIASSREETSVPRRSGCANGKGLASGTLPLPSCEYKWTNLRGINQRDGHEADQQPLSSSSQNIGGEKMPLLEIITIAQTSKETAGLGTKEFRNGVLSAVTLTL